MSKLNNFILVAKKDFIEHKKTILIAVGSMIGVCIVSGAYMGYLGMGGGYGELGFYCFLLGISGYAFASVMFSDMKSKQSRISTLMLPASSFEKYMVRWIAFVPVLFLISVMAFYLGDLSRYIVGKIMSSNYDMRVAPLINPWDGLCLLPLDEVRIPYSALSTYFFYQSIFLFGAILWPKLSFVKTVGAIWVMQTVLVTIMMIFPDIIHSMHFQNDSTPFIISGIIVNILTLVCYYLAYLKFKKSEVNHRLF